MRKQQLADWKLVIVICLLVTMGILMVYSASSIWANYKFDDPLYFGKRQFLFATIGLIAMFVVSHIPYHTWRKYSKHILITCIVLLVLVLIPGIGLVRGGARSWIGVGAFSIQPAEFIKLGLLIFLSDRVAERQKEITSFKKGLGPLLLLIFFCFGLIMLQPDLGTGLILVGSCIILLFIAGAQIKHFVFLAILGLAGLTGLIASAPYRINRITAFINPWDDPLGNGFQIIQSLYAIGPGGLFGLGYGNSLQKYFYLPEPHNDFIFSIIAEELGFIGATIILLLFLYLLWKGVQIGINAPDKFGSLLSIGIVLQVSLQVIINISVVIGLIPVTGITLPFLSYGGSSLTLTLAAMGIVLNISRYGQY
ncbi:stage V sporulation protein E [Amphibacillus xylanus]|uniref:Stage V sporulation protein E n=1 Tax=Amphibacillus xylanus (strain ATCC 51415 / DSM 6626 / JCM 7361 / LMG 17667 / NBRC 15112 / Ep01) TaxID=698758 RepID=K0IZ31_AMPXN|nr:stage V sporulation protein E [Amphibacillus xylanus]BAM47719.1 stage V sporulation protein E [Amphibacillus xylanus NBRC 15112]